MECKRICLAEMREHLEAKDGKVFVGNNIIFHLEGGGTRKVVEFFITTVPFISGKVYATENKRTSSEYRTYDYIPVKKVLFIEKSGYE